MVKKENKKSNTTNRKTKAESQQGRRTSVRVGNISGGTGFAIGPGATANVTQIKGLGTDEISQAFAILQQKVGELPKGPDKDLAENTVNALASEAQKGEEADPSRIQRWMEFLSDTAPDVWEVAIDTFTNPIKGLGTVFKKVADRAKAERNAKKAKSSKK